MSNVFCFTMYLCIVIRVYITCDDHFEVIQANWVIQANEDL